LEEEIKEEINEPNDAKEAYLLDPKSGEKVQTRKKVVCRLEVGIPIHSW
jgi:hypothetical protein